MDAEREKLREFVERVGTFHLRGNAMLRAQRRMRESLASGQPVTSAQVAAYLRAVRRYFSEFEKEARQHVGDLDRRLSHVSQLQFNLTAERGVALRRIEITQGVLRALAELGD
ncbi:MAG TPA: hypothetical protein VME66_03360 [Candidatus Acidoferrales bacterium]|nr:hypothetical protein [Candidatus Acidoferrales bacterium]